MIQSCYLVGRLELLPAGSDCIPWPLDAVEWETFVMPGLAVMQAGVG